jgi:ribosomal protein S6--L-glutamate ligase
VQEFIAEAKGADLRCFVVGGKVIAAMRRQAPKGDFRSNLHRGGRARAVKPTAAEQETAVRAARLLGLGICGVDLIRSRRGPLILEVNASPGLEGIESASGVDIAGHIVEYVAGRQKRRSAKLQTSVRQRQAVKKPRKTL